MSTRRRTALALGLFPPLIMVPFTILAVRFDYPDVLRTGAASLLPAFQAGGAPLVAVWFAYALAIVPFLVAVVALPAVLGVSSEINEPRYPAMKGIMAANRAQIPAWSLEDLGMTDSTRLVELERVYMEERSGNVELVQGDSGAEIGAKLADRLREAGVI